MPDLPAPPLQYQALMWARDMNVSYFDILKAPMGLINTYLEMRELEDEFASEQIVE